MTKTYASWHFVIKRLPGIRVLLSGGKGQDQKLTSPNVTTDCKQMESEAA
jgi:hypothetical protein